MLGALAGVLYVGTTGAADPNSGLTYLLPAFAAAFLGATSINPGPVQSDRFGHRGLFPGHRHHRPVDPRHLHLVQDLFYGGALVVAVALSQLVRGREERLT